MNVSPSFKRLPHGIMLFFLLISILSACGSETPAANPNATTSEPTTVHLAHFPNLTHAVALVGVERETFKKSLEPHTLDVKTFNAGPDVINAMLAGSIDIAYIGPNPAINGYVQSKGEGLRIIAGASSGGALFIVNPNSNIKKASDLAGKTLATPQKGGTQDIALRHYLQENGLKPDDQGGTVKITPTENANILSTFKQEQLDGAWVPEPWASRLIIEGKGTIFVDERDVWPDRKFVTTNVIVRKEFLDQHPDIVKKFLEAHLETVQYIQANTEETKLAVNSQLEKLTTKPIAKEVLDQAYKNLDITYDPLAKTLFKSADDAFNLKLLKEKPDKDIYYLDPLNEILASKGLPKVAAA